MLIFHNHEQGTPEWKEARRGLITGSQFKVARERLKNGNLSAAAKLYAMNVARERCGGTAPEVYQNAAMRTGTEQEPLAREAYECWSGNLVQVVGFVSTDDRMFGVSPDGLVDEGGIIEIKTMVSSDTFMTAVVERDISDYIDQVNGELWLLGRLWCDLILWAPDMAEIGLDLTVIRINRNESNIDALADDLVQFSKIVRGYESAIRLAAKR